MKFAPLAANGTALDAQFTQQLCVQLQQFPEWAAITGAAASAVGGAASVVPLPPPQLVGVVDVPASESLLGAPAPSTPGSSQVQIALAPT